MFSLQQLRSFQGAPEHRRAQTLRIETLLMLLLIVHVVALDVDVICSQRLNLYDAALSNQTNMKKFI